MSPAVLKVLVPHQQMAASWEVADGVSRLRPVSRPVEGGGGAVSPPTCAATRPRVCHSLKPAPCLRPPQGWGLFPTQIRYPPSVAARQPRGLLERTGTPQLSGFGLIGSGCPRPSGTSSLHVQGFIMREVHRHPPLRAVSSSAKGGGLTPRSGRGSRAGAGGRGSRVTGPVLGGVVASTCSFARWPRSLPPAGPGRSSHASPLRPRLPDDGPWHVPETAAVSCSPQGPGSCPHPRSAPSPLSCLRGEGNREAVVGGCGMSCLCATRLQTFLRAHICVNTGCSSLPLGSPGRGGRDAAALGPAVPPAGWPPPVLTSCPRKRFLVSASKKNPALIGPCPGLVPGQRGEAGCRPEGSQQRRTLRGGRCHCAQWPHVWLKPAPRLSSSALHPPLSACRPPWGRAAPHTPEWAQNTRDAGACLTLALTSQQRGDPRRDGG